MPKEMKWDYFTPKLYILQEREHPAVPASGFHTVAMHRKQTLTLKSKTLQGVTALPEEIPFTVHQLHLFPGHF